MKLSSVIRDNNENLPLLDGVELIDCDINREDRGNLSFFEHSALPFLPKRTFIISGVPSGTRRGEHAHKECLQFMVCISGLIHCEVKSGDSIIEFEMDTPQRGILIPAGVWASQTYMSQDAVLLVFASHEYDPADYIYNL